MATHIFADEIPSAVSPDECSKLAELAHNRTVLEVGSWLGRSTVALASVAKAVHAVDWHKGDAHSGEGHDTLAEFTANLVRRGVRDKVVIHVGRNEEILPTLTPGMFDLVFVDSFHTREAVERDISLVRPLVAIGGTIAFHDYGISHGDPPFGVTQAVDAFCASLGIWKPEVTGTLAVVRLL